MMEKNKTIRDRMNIVKKAIENNEMLQLLEGKNGYSIQNDSFASISAPIDWTVVIPMIYEEYANTANKDIVEMYVTAIKDMLTCCNNHGRIGSLTDHKGI